MFFFLTINGKPYNIDADPDTPLLWVALRGKITIDKGRVQQSNFDDYQLLRFDEMPEVKARRGQCRVGGKRAARPQIVDPGVNLGGSLNVRKR